MNSSFKSKLLQRLLRKKDSKGFTLIELLVVVVIVGVLAAIGLPNLLSQVGKAREVEGKNAVGTINRSQQAYHFEKSVFSSLDNDTLAEASNALGVVIASKYYSFTTTGDASQAISPAQPKDADNDGVRSYAGSIGYKAGLYDTALCQSDTVGGEVTAAVDVSGDVDANCTTGTELE